MKEEMITVTEAARNFDDCVNRAHLQKTTFILLEKGRPVAKLVPIAERHCTGPQLAEIIRNITLTPEESRAWEEDLKAARNRY